MYISTLQALTLLKEAGRLRNTWRALDEGSKLVLKAEATELKEAMGEARKASLAAIQKTGGSLQKKGLGNRLTKAMDLSQEGDASGAPTLLEASVRVAKASRTLALHLREIEKQGTRGSTAPRAASETLDYPYVSPVGTGPIGTSPVVPPPWFSGAPESHADGTPSNPARNRVS